MSASILQAASAAQAGGASSWGVALSNTTAGSGLLYVSFINNGRTISGVADTQGNTYTSLTTANVDDGSLQMRFWYALNIVGGAAANTATATFDGAVATVGGALIEIGGIKTSSALDGAVGQSQTNPGTSADAVTSGNASSSAQPAIVIGVSVRRDGTTAPAKGTGFSNPTAGTAAAAAFYNDYQFRIEWKRVTTTGNQAATFTAGNAADDFMTSIIVFDEAASLSPTAARYYYGAR